MPDDVEHLASYLHNLIHMMPRPKPKGPWIRIVEQEEKPSVIVEDLLELLQTKKEKDTPLPEREKPFLVGSPIATTALGIMIVALGIMVIILKSDIVVLKNDITDLKNLKAQVATLDPKIQITNIKSKLEDMKKGMEATKGEMVQLQTELETIKTERKKGKNKAPNRLRDRPPSIHNTVWKKEIEEVLHKKTSPQDMFFSDVFRAMSFDPPPK
jgi:hypothetical protein